MALRDLIQFVQQHYSAFQDVTNARQRNPNIVYEPFPGDLNAFEGSTANSRLA